MNGDVFVSEPNAADSWPGRPDADHDLLVGLDIGGTKTEALVVDAQMNRLAQIVRPTDAGDPDSVVRGATATVNEALSQCGRKGRAIQALGVAVPGLVEPEGGVVRLAVNLNLVSYPLGPALSEIFSAPAYLENDVRTGAMGAYHYVNQRSTARDLAYLSIGTGIAAGITLDGQLHRGATGMAGEIGHVIMEPGGERCGCGMPGCLEAVAAGPAVARLGNQSLGARDDGSEWTARAVYAAAEAGDKSAQQAVNHVSGYYARAIQLLIMAYDVQRVALGGGVSRAGDAFLNPILAALAQMRAESQLAREMLADEKVMLLPVDYSAGAWGAILLAQQGDR